MPVEPSPPPENHGTSFETGAVRSSDANHVRFDLIGQVGLRRLAETCKEGYDKYGAHNWTKGMPIGDILNHALLHINKYLSGDDSEDHLGHAAWNLFAAMEMEEKKPELYHELPPDHPVTERSLVYRTHLKEQEPQKTRDFTKNGDERRTHQRRSPNSR